MKKFINTGKSSFEEIKNKADQVLEFKNMEDFYKTFSDPKSLIRRFAEYKLMLTGYYTYLSVGKNNKSIKVMMMLSNGRTHKLNGTKLVSI
jgi:TnpA family transposase